MTTRTRLEKHVVKKRGVSSSEASDILERETIFAFTEASAAFDSFPASIEDEIKIMMSRRVFADCIRRFAEDDFYPGDLLEIESLGGEMFDAHRGKIMESFDIFAVDIARVEIDTDVNEKCEVVMTTQSVRRYLRAYKDAVRVHKDMPSSYKVMTCKCIDDHLAALVDSSCLIVWSALEQIDVNLGEAESGPEINVLEVLYSLFNTVLVDYKVNPDGR
jgi:hypothetical protein